jgi:hypothetical protein
VYVVILIERRNQRESFQSRRQWNKISLNEPEFWSIREELTEIDRCLQWFAKSKSATEQLLLQECRKVLFAENYCQAKNWTLSVCTNISVNRHQIEVYIKETHDDQE